MHNEGDRVEPSSSRRRGTIDYMRMAGSRSNVHGLVEIDVTEARDEIRAIAEDTGEHLSFTGFIVFCLGRAIEDHPQINAYRDWRGRTHVFDDVDVNVLIESTVQGEQLGVPHVIRATNRRSLRSIHDEIRTAQGSPDPTDLSRWSKLALQLPGLIRRQVWRLPQWFPRRWKGMAGTVAVTSIGMFGQGSGWAVAPTNYTVQLTVGGIDTRPRYIDGEVTPQEILNLTVTFDHDVVDGAAATRFTHRLRELIEGAHGIPTPNER